LGTLKGHILAALGASMRTSVAVAVGIVATIGLSWIIGIRVFVIQPIGTIPHGVTAIVVGVPGLRFIDSPDAFCMRHMRTVNLLCRGMTAAKVADEGTILLRLPYSEILYGWSGAPETYR